jgi:hypothetical protein
MFRLRKGAHHPNLTTVFPVVSTVFHYAVLKSERGSAAVSYLGGKQCFQQVHGKAINTDPNSSDCMRTCSFTKVIFWGHYF